jgi:MFS family permease
MRIISMKLQSLFRALTHRSFAFLWAGQTISSVGDSVYQVALVWWVLVHTGSALAMGVVLLCERIPALVLLLFGGVMVDRFPRVWLMLLSDLIRGILVSIIALLAFTDTLAVWHVYVVSFAFGMVGAFFYPAYRAVMPELSSTDLLPSANALTSLSTQATGILGPSLGAIIVAVGGSPIAFTLDAVSFILSAVCLFLLLPQATHPKESGRGQGMLHEVRQGLGYVVSTRWLGITIAIAGLSNLAYYPTVVALPFLVKYSLHANVDLLGLYYSAIALGAVLGASWIGRFTLLRRRGLTSYGAWMLTGLALAVIGLVLTPWVFLLAAMIFGGANEVLSLIWVNAIQEKVPRELQGRVYSIDYFGSSLLGPAGYLVGGWVTPLLGPVLVFILGGALQTALIGLGLLHPGVRELD